MKTPLIIGVLLAGILVHAQQYSINWYKVSGGGGTSTGGVYSISGTIGQHDAGGAMSGGNYSVTGGFWSLYAVQTPGAPLLIITHVGNQAMLSWDSSVTGWTLQTNNNLSTGTWGNYTRHCRQQQRHQFAADGKCLLSAETIIGWWFNSSFPLDQIPSKLFYPFAYFVCFVV